MGNLFGKKSILPPKNCEITEQDQAILRFVQQLKLQRDKIKQFIRRKEKCIETENDMARRLIKEGRKEGVHDLEFADIQQRVIEGLREGNDALKKMNAIFDIGEIEKLMEETKEAADYQEEISALLSNHLSTTDVHEAEQELEQLLFSQQSDITLPDVPQQELPQKDIDKPTKSRKRDAVAMEA
ncbi:SNF7 family protein [Dictyocaulus viviparus]|uniref:SNF7 family protein n=1 Tax=Dictyocaulus viviparus TaxID=29172 RepID=A0A0D8XS37_DICVI|nr:SNF7 family protein [Dictyocaulus viviparus]